MANGANGTNGATKIWISIIAAVAIAGIGFLFSHTQKIGHPVIVERVSSLAKDIESIKKEQRAFWVEQRKANKELMEAIKHDSR